MHSARTSLESRVTSTEQLTPEVLPDDPKTAWSQRRGGDVEVMDIATELAATTTSFFYPRRTEGRITCTWQVVALQSRARETSALGRGRQRSPRSSCHPSGPAKHKADGGVRRRQSDNPLLGCAPAMTASPKAVQAQTLPVDGQHRRFLPPSV